MSQRTMPAQRPGQSEQDVETPSDFLRAVVRRFGPLTWDLAATVENRKAPFCYTPEQDSLVQHWHHERHRGNLWLNPPFGDIARWARKCAEESALVHADPERTDRYDWRVLLLVPASVSANWYAEHVHGRALVMPLRPRLTFVGQDDPFPKDLMLAAFGERPGFEPWRWD